ncbi:hypothetical protein R1flu_007899 [Riccia fluitans]|uniref:Endonuclease/exonuclease/phosphatase domain-containing protein n=1 Tax=Riccia fluitans TaxID=41844 RepID=A0ABD1Z0F8_9MARC
MGTWNVQGLGDKDNYKVVEAWTKKVGKHAKILALEEMKAGEENVSRNIANLFPEARCIVDYTVSDRGGAALIVYKTHKILESGIKGDGTAAWATIEIEDGQLGVMSVHGPQNDREKANFFNWLRAFEHEGQWILLGDWTMVTELEDSVGPTPMIHGHLARKWRGISQAWDLVDAFQVAGKREGPFFTRQALVRTSKGDPMDQSRLDRVYININTH